MGIHSAGARADLYLDDRRPYVGYGNGVHQKRPDVSASNWTRVVTPSCTYKLGGEQTVTGVLLDPPYDLRIARSRRTGSDGAAPTDKLYASHDNDLSAEVRGWAVNTGARDALELGTGLLERTAWLQQTQAARGDLVRSVLHQAARAARL